MDKNTAIVAGGSTMDIGCRVILWSEEAGMSFYGKGKYKAREANLQDLQKEIKLFILHHSVTYTAKQTYSGLIARGLSVNFIIDDDDIDGYATVYQCLDVKDAGLSHGPFNKSGPGVEICYHPTAWQTPNAYSPENIKKYGVQPHHKVQDTVHRMNLEVFAPTEAQIRSCTALLKGFCRLFPQVKPEFPKDNFGQIIKTIVPNPKNLLFHYNLTFDKIDPLGFPNDKVEKCLKQELGFYKIEKSLFSSLFSFFKKK